MHVGQVLEYTQAPTYLRDLVLHRLTLEAQQRVAKSPLSKRESVRRLGTSAAQLYRLVGTWCSARGFQAGARADAELSA
jgi:hypothetical protein